MLINFIGSPHSGKTTLAARLFDHFKTNDLACEFLTERARHYIVEKRIRERLKPGQKVFLNDEDQLQIIKQQLQVEGSYFHTCPQETCIISDSSPLNTLWYLSEEARKRPEISKYVKASLSMNPLVFWTPYIPGGNRLDINRIHDPRFCEDVETKIPTILKEFAPDLQVIDVHGTATDRYHQVLNRILKAYGIE